MCKPAAVRDTMNQESCKLCLLHHAADYARLMSSARAWRQVRLMTSNLNECAHEFSRMLNTTYQVGSTDQSVAGASIDPRMGGRGMEAYNRFANMSECIRSLHTTSWRTYSPGALDRP